MRRLDQLRLISLLLGAFVVVSAVTVVAAIVVVASEADKREQWEYECQRTCVYQGKLRVVTVTEAPGCYCAEYDAIHKVRIIKER